MKHGGLAILEQAGCVRVVEDFLLERFGVRLQAHFSEETADFAGELQSVQQNIDKAEHARAAAAAVEQKYAPGAVVKNSLVASGCIINGQVENSILFKKVFVGNNCVIKNSIILNDVYLGDNTHIENCVVESRDTIRANSYYCGEDGIKVVIEKNERYVL